MSDKNQSTSEAPAPQAAPDRCAECSASPCICDVTADECDALAAGDASSLLRESIQAQIDGLREGVRL